MAWYVWLLLVWASLMGLLALKALFPVSNLLKEKGSINDFLGCVGAVLIILSTHQYLFDFNASVLLVLTVITLLSVLVSILISIKENNSDTEINKMAKGEAVLAAINDTRASNGDVLGAGIAAMSAANEQESELKLALIISIVLLTPNLVAIYLGVRHLINA